MVHIQPVSEESADGEVRRAYRDVKFQLGLNQIPYYFQLIAAYPDLLGLLWFKLRPTVTDPEFQSIIKKLVQESEKTLTPTIPYSQKVELLLERIGPEEKSQMATDSLYLQKVNATMLLISVLVRETIKGLPGAKAAPKQYLPDSVTKLTIGLTNSNDSEIAKGESAISFTASKDPYSYVYLQLIADLMATLSKTKEYLSVRVSLEEKTQELIRKLPQPLELTYSEVIKTIFDKPYVDELIYLLHDAFPGFFPKQFLSSLALKICLERGSKVIPIGKNIPQEVESDHVKRES